MTCFNLSLGGIETIYLYFKENHPANGMKISKINSYKICLSWNEAAQLCKDTGGYLPYFTSRNELEQLIALMKFSKDIFPVEAIYIGLNLNTTIQVKV